MIEAVEMGAVQAEVQSRIEPLLLEVADVVNTTLDLDTTLRRVAELVRKVIDYEIFGILLLNEKTQELYFRFSVGHSKETADRIRVRVGEGVTGVAAQRAEAVLVDDVSQDARYISAVPNVRSELAVPLIDAFRLLLSVFVRGRVHVHFATAEDLETSARVFSAMDASETPGTRSSVDSCEVKLELRAPGS